MQYPLLNMETDKTELRAVIKFLTLEGSGPKEIFDRMKVVYNGSCPSLRTVERWSKEYRHGRKSLEDDPRSGRPCDVTTDRKVAEIESYHE